MNQKGLLLAVQLKPSPFPEWGGPRRVASGSRSDAPGGNFIREMGEERVGVKDSPSPNPSRPARGGSEETLPGRLRRQGRGIPLERTLTKPLFVTCFLLLIFATPFGASAEPPKDDPYGQLSIAFPSQTRFSRMNLPRSQTGLFQKNYIPTKFGKQDYRELFYSVPARQEEYRFKYKKPESRMPGPPPPLQIGRVKLWFGSFRLNKSHAITYDSVNLLKGKEDDLENNFWACGLNISDIPIVPSSKGKTLKWLSGGIDLFIFAGDYTIIATQGSNQQKSELDFTTIAIAGTLKISPFSDGVRPYIGIGVGPAWTNLIDTRITTLDANPPLREHDRVWDTSNLFEAFAGCDIYLGKRFYFTIEYRWLHLTNKHLLFPDETTNHHTAKVKTYFKDWLSTFGLGIRF